jgi:hypothetical protein
MSAAVTALARPVGSVSVPTRVMTVVLPAARFAGAR